MNIAGSLDFCPVCRKERDEMPKSTTGGASNGYEPQEPEQIAPVAVEVPAPEPAPAPEPVLPPEPEPHPEMPVPAAASVRMTRTGRIPVEEQEKE